MHAHVDVPRSRAVHVGEGFGDTSFLSSDEQPNAQVHVIAKRESTEINAFLGDSVLRQPSSVELGWNNLAVERRTSLPYEEPELILRHHFLILWDVHVAEGESAYRRGRFSPYKKYPNTISTCHPGIRPAARSRFKHEVIVGALHPDFIRGIEEELDKRRAEPSKDCTEQTIPSSGICSFFW
jgi:hypothetical protein